tara:strand:- start:294 stop:524 length:231 start_codon:yes stop_codon:yes gene_type:complete
MASSDLGDMPNIANYEDTYYALSEWEHFVIDEAISRGIDTNDSDKMEELDEILQEEAQDHRDHLEEMAYEASQEGY